jgi:hypothetical protein
MSTSTLLAGATPSAGAAFALAVPKPSGDEPERAPPLGVSGAAFGACGCSGSPFTEAGLAGMLARVIGGIGPGGTDLALGRVLGLAELPGNEPGMGIPSRVLWRARGGRTGLLGTAAGGANGMGASSGGELFFANPSKTSRSEPLFCSDMNDFSSSKLTQLPRAVDDMPHHSNDDLRLAPSLRSRYACLSSERRNAAVG